MKILAQIKCNECGKEWQFSKQLEEITKDDLKCCGEYGEVEKSFQEVDDGEELSMSAMQEKVED